MSTGLRVFISDALALLQAAVEPGADAGRDLVAALIPLGFEPNPAHRPGADNTQRRLELAAAVEVISALPTMNKNKAVDAVAEIAKRSQWTVWQALKGVQDWPPGTAERMAEPVRAQARELVAEQPYVLLKPVVRWATEEKSETSAK